GQVAEAQQCLDVLRLLLAYLSELRPIDQSVLHVLESADDRLFVCVESLSLQSFGLRDLTADAACIKNRLRDARSERPNVGRAFEKIRELAAFKAEQPS